MQCSAVLTCIQKNGSNSNHPTQDSRVCTNTHKHILKSHYRTPTGIYCTHTTHHVFAISCKGFLHIQSPHSILHIVVHIDGTLSPNCWFRGGPIDSLRGVVARLGMCIKLSLINHSLKVLLFTFLNAFLVSLYVLLKPATRFIMKRHTT